jgi:hypothetical protein
MLLLAAVALIWRWLGALASSPPFRRSDSLASGRPKRSKSDGAERAAPLRRSGRESRRLQGERPDRP